MQDLREIANDPLNRNIVVVFSNQSVLMLEDHFNQLIKDDVENLWFAAESGYQYSTGQMASPQNTDELKAGLQQPQRKWCQLISLANKIWFNAVYQIMMTYTENVDGAVVEERDSTLVWNHKNAEEEQGNMVVGELYA